MKYVQSVECDPEKRGRIFSSVDQVREPLARIVESAEALDEANKGWVAGQYGAHAVGVGTAIPLVLT